MQLIYHFVYHRVLWHCVVCIRGLYYALPCKYSQNNMCITVVYVFLKYLNGVMLSHYQNLAPLIRNANFPDFVIMLSCYSAALAGVVIRCLLRLKQVSCKHHFVVKPSGNASWKVLQTTFYIIASDKMMQ